MISKPNGPLVYTPYPCGIINMSNNLITETGLEHVEFAAASFPSLTTPGTPSAAVVGTPVTISGEVWAGTTSYSDFYRWIYFATDGTGNTGNLTTSNVATYTPVSADVGKTIARVTIHTASNSFRTCGVSNPVVVTA